MPVVADVLSYPVVVATGAGTVVLTVPANRTAVVRTVSLTNVTGAAVFFALDISPGGGGFVQSMLATVPGNVTDGSSVPWFVLRPGDVLRYRAGTAASLVVGTFGYMLVGTVPAWP